MSWTIRNDDEQIVEDMIPGTYYRLVPVPGSTTSLMIESYTHEYLEESAFKRAAQKLQELIFRRP